MFVGVARSLPDVATFVTPIFSDGNNGYLSQDVAGGRIVGFNKIFVGREFQQMDFTLAVNVGDPAIYGFESSNDNFIIGPAIMLAPIINEWRLSKAGITSLAPATTTVVIRFLDFVEKDLARTTLPFPYQHVHNIRRAVGSNEWTIQVQNEENVPSITHRTISMLRAAWESTHQMLAGRNSVQILTGLMILVSTLAIIYQVKQPEIQILSHQVAGLPASSPRPTKIKNEIENLITSLADGKKTEFYEITPLASVEMVKIESSDGKYFSVNIKTSTFPNGIIFPPGKYAFDTENQELNMALGSLQNEVMNLAIRGGAHIYIKGMADSLGGEFKRPITKVSCGAETFFDIKYHKLTKKISEYTHLRHLNQLIPKKHLISYGNTLLPELRARFIQCKYMELFPNVVTEIIQGEIYHEEDPTKRNATIILFIPQSIY